MVELQLAWKISRSRRQRRLEPALQTKIWSVREENWFWANQKEVSGSAKFIRCSFHSETQTPTLPPAS